MPVVISTIASVLGLIVTIAGIAISAMHVGRVKGAGLLLAGFSLQAFAGLIFRLATFAMSGSLAGTYTPFAFGSVLSVAGGVVVVAGVYTVLTTAARTAGS